VVAVAVAAAVAVAVAVVIPTPLRLQQPTVVLEGGWRGNACQVLKNTEWCLAPTGSSAFGIRVTGIRPSPQRLVKWEDSSGRHAEELQVASAFHCTN